MDGPQPNKWCCQIEISFFNMTKQQTISNANHSFIYFSSIVIGMFELNPDTTQINAYFW